MTASEILPAAPSRKRRNLVIALVAILLLAASGWFVWSSTKGNDTGAQAQGGRHGQGGGAPVPAAIATAQKGDIDITRQGLGTVTPVANIALRTQINGQLLDVAFQEGQMVQKGDYLAQIDPRPYQTALEQAEGNLQRDKALLKEAQLNFERYKKLVAQDSIAKQQLDTQESLVQQYVGTIQTDQGQVDNAKLNLVYCHITSPISGRIGIRQVDQGNYVQTSDTNGLVTITQLQPIDVMFTLPEDDVPTVMKRLKEGAQLPVSAFDRTQSVKLAEGKLLSVDNQINISTGTVKLRAEFDNQDGSLFPNQFVNVVLLIDTLHDTIIVPSAAIQRGAPGTFVYLVKDDSTVTVKPIKLGPVQGDNVAVLDGLSAGDKVVIGGSDKLRDGAAIKLPDDKETSSSGKKGAKK